MKKTFLKTINFIEKYDNIFAVIFIFLSIFGITLNVIITNSDELWNFQNVYKMYNGFQIYKEANVIITPLFFWIGEILFKILGANFLTFRIYNIMIMATLYFITYLLLKKMNIDKKISFIIILLFIIYKKHYLILCQANYNTMALLFWLIGIFFLISKNKYNNIIQGSITFFVFITKQNMGIFYGIGCIFYEIFSKNTRKNKIKNLAIEISIFLTLLLSVFIHFYQHNNLDDFFNYCFLGISEFANKNLVINILVFILTIFFIVINFIVTNILVKNKKISIMKEEKEQLVILNCFSIPLTFVMIPIFNESHFMIGIYVSLLLFFNIMKIIISKLDIKKMGKTVNLLLISLVIFSCTYSIRSFVNWFNIINSSEYKIEKENPFYGGVTTKEFLESIEKVDEYIKKSTKQVIVLSNKAALYMIPLKRSNGIMDLPFKGNLGKEGEKGLIEKIKNTQNLEILIEKDESNLLYQESKEIREYIMNQMKNIGEIEEFLIYQ